MDISADRLEFAPPAARGLSRAFTLAALAHLLLAAGLTWGVHWKTSSENAMAEAELWSRMPQLQAPKAVEAPTPHAPPPRATPEPPRSSVANADIVRERERKLQAEKEKKLLEERREEQLRREAQKQKEDAQKLAADKKRAETEREAKERAQEKERKELQARREQERLTQQEASKLAELRAANMRRLTGLAGSTGAPSATGTAAQASGPSASYGSRVAAKVRPNIVFTEDLPSNPEAVVEVRTLSDGTILSRRLKKSSGSKAWDETVLRAIDKTETLPRDTDGRVPQVLDIGFRPRD